MPKFLALLDVENNFDFTLREQQLREWAGIEPDLLMVLEHIEITGRP